MKASTIKKINEHLEKARKKHPEFAPGGRLQVVSLSAEELGEMAQAVNDWYTKPDMLCDWVVQLAKNICWQETKH